MVEFTSLVGGFKASQDFLEKISGKIQRELKLKKEISVVLASSRHIKQLNKKYRDQDRPTDVLSFEDLNEIYLCPAVIGQGARQRRRDFNEELTRALVHGILHLLGCRHESDKKSSRQMMARQEKILKNIL